MGGDPQWRNFTALDEYYQNGPLPTWIGWYMQHLPPWFHAATAMGTLLLELGLVWMMFLPRRLHILCFLIITPWQIGIILSANYTFLNYLVLALGILLLDDRFVLPWLPRFMKRSYLTTKEAKPLSVPAPEDKWRTRLRAQGSALKIAVTAVMLTWIFYATLAQMVWMVKPWPRWTTPVSALEPFRADAMKSSSRVPMMDKLGLSIRSVSSHKTRARRRGFTRRISHGSIGICGLHR